MAILIALSLLAGIGLSGALLIHRKFRQNHAAAAMTIDSPRRIVEERFVTIGGIHQWIGIRGEDRDNPLLLLLHGGPGSSYSIFARYLRAWEKHFTIVQWDQRGGGRTFGRTGERGSGELSMEQLTRDSIEVAEYLRTHLGQDRIFLLASSFGSTFGIEVAHRRPDLFYAYVGVDQNVGMPRGADQGRCEALERLRCNGLNKGVKALERISNDPTCWTCDDFRTVVRWTMKSDYSGSRETMKLLKDAIWYAPGWTFKDLRTFVKGMHFSLERLLPEASRFDVWDTGTRFEIPFFIFQGEHDVLTPPKLAQEYFNDVTAPYKFMALVRDAGHFAAFQQPENFLYLLLAHVRPLA